MSAADRGVESTTSGASWRECPFKGPEPFAEQDADRFFGRDSEIGDLLGKVRDQRLTVLTAESGAGKTSLIQAGLIPALRLLREESDARPPGPVICIQGRGPEPAASAAPVLVHRIREEIIRLLALCDDTSHEKILGGRKLRDDLKHLHGVPSPPDPVPPLEPGSVEERQWLLAFVGALCDAVPDRRLILVIDQLEELLGSGASVHSRAAGALAIQLIGTAFVREERLQLLLSLREEYLGRLRPLDDLVGALIRRTCHITPLTTASFRQSVLLTANGFSGEETRTPSIATDAVEQILAWASGAAASADNLPVDALVAQAILKDVWLSHSERPESRGAGWTTAIDDDALERYRRDLDAIWRDEERPGHSDVGWIAESAMFRHIDRALRSPDAPRSAGVTQDHLMHVAARMGPTLSSPRGFKRHVTDVQLVQEALREDLRTPPMAGVTRTHLETRVPSLRAAFFGSTDAAPLLDATASSALSKADLLASAALGAISRLEAGNVLKNHGVDEHGNRVIALQHDGFGPAFDRWGEQHRNRLEDALASVVGCFGLPIRRGAELRDRTVDGLVWVGCRLDSVRFQGVRFLHCNFSGSWMENCTFEDCEFTECQLPALGIMGGAVSNTVFRHCDLKSLGVLGSVWCRVHIEHCEANGMLVRNECTWREYIEIADTTLSSAIFENVRLEGRVRIERAILWFAQLRPFLGSVNGVEIRDCRLHGALVADYDRVPDTNKSGNLEIGDYGITRLPSSD